ncbi:MAG: response regulator, partial [Rhodothermales bacterium]
MNPTSRHILLADDNPVNRKVLQHMLGRLGHTVEPVTTGKEAFEKASSSYDLIFMDMMMPVMDGLEATRLIRQYEEGRR